MAISTNDAVLQKAHDMRRHATPFALATVVRSVSPASAKPGAKAIIHANGKIEGWIGGGCAQPAVIATAKKAIRDGRPRLIRVSPNKGAAEEGIVDFGMTCHSGGVLDIFIEPMLQRPTLLILGGSPAAQTLAALASRVGFTALAACPGADRSMFPDALHVSDGFDLPVDMTDATPDFATPDFIVVATQGKHDERALQAALACESPYVTFIASRRKAQKLREWLVEQGHDAARVESVIAPAGIDIGASAPEEIALSVLAALVKHRREAGADDNAMDKEEQSVDTATDPVCGMRVEIAGAEYTASHQGRDYYFCCAGCQSSFEKNPRQYLGEAAV